MKKEEIKQGIYKDLDINEYHADSAVSSSVIKDFIESDECPAIFYSKYLDPSRPPRKPTKAMEFGSHAHLRILEPEKFDSSFIVAPATYIPDNLFGVIFL